MLTRDTSQSTKVEKLYLNQDNMILMLRGKRGIRINSKQAPHTTENGSVVSEMDTVFKNGQMVLNMRGSGKTIELTARASSFILMETSTMGSG